MNKSIVRCRCGHQVLAKEVLRTDLYERRASEGAGREYVYVKFRCRRCKRMGEAFVAESRWDWSILEAEPGEMSDAERDHFLDEAPISAEEILDFHRRLESVLSLSELDVSVTEAESGEAEFSQPHGNDASPQTPEARAGGTPASLDAAAPLSPNEPPRDAERERAKDQKPSMDFVSGASGDASVLGVPEKPGAVNPANAVNPVNATKPMASEGGPSSPEV